MDGGTKDTVLNKMKIVLKRKVVQPNRETTDWIFYNVLLPVHMNYLRTALLVVLADKKNSMTLFMNL